MPIPSNGFMPTLLAAPRPAPPTLIEIDIGVLVVVGVTFGTIAFVLLPRSRNTSSTILEMSDQFKMKWVYTTMIAAEMVGFHTFRNWPAHKFVSKAVSTKSLTFIGDAAISFVLKCSPFPTAGSCYGDLFSHSLWK